MSVFAEEVEHYTNIGLTQLIRAATSGQLDTVKPLYPLAAGIQVLDCVSDRSGSNRSTSAEDVSDNHGRTHLILAVMHSHAPVVEYLCQRGEEVDVCDERGRNALHYSAMRENPEVARTLLDYSADINYRDKNGMTALHLATYSANITVIRVLLERGASLKLKDNNKRTPEKLAKQMGYHDIHRLLRDKNIIRNYSRQNKQVARSWRSKVRSIFTSSKSVYDCINKINEPPSIYLTTEEEEEEPADDENIYEKIEEIVGVTVTGAAATPTADSQHGHSSEAQRPLPLLPARPAHQTADAELDLYQNTSPTNICKPQPTTVAATTGSVSHVYNNAGNEKLDVTLPAQMPLPPPKPQKPLPPPKPQKPLPPAKPQVLPKPLPRSKVLAQTSGLPELPTQHATHNEHASSLLPQEQAKSDTSDKAESDKPTDSSDTSDKAESDKHTDSSETQHDRHDCCHGLRQAMEPIYQFVKNYSQPSNGAGRNCCHKPSPTATAVIEHAQGTVNLNVSIQLCNHNNFTCQEVHVKKAGFLNTGEGPLNVHYNTLETDCGQDDEGDYQYVDEPIVGTSNMGWEVACHWLQELISNVGLAVYNQQDTGFMSV